MPRLINEIEKRIPLLSNAHEFLYIKPACHSIRGLLFECPSQIIYVYKLFLPLFDDFEYIYLTLSERVSSVDTTNMRRGDVVDEVVRVAQQNILDLPDHPETLMQYLNTFCQTSISVRKTKGLLMVMTGDYQLAREMLIGVMFSEGHALGVKRGVQDIITLLDIDPDEARRELARRETFNRKRFGLE